MLCKVVSRHESKDVLLKAFKVGIVERLDGGVLDGAVHAFGLAVGPGVVWLGELMFDAVLMADAVEGVVANLPPGWPAAVLWQIGESRAVVGKHGVNGIGERLDDAAQEVGAVHFSCVVAKLDVGKQGTRLIVRNILSLPLARRSSLTSICT